jgi:opacity protein-like surface antigen
LGALGIATASTAHAQAVASGPTSPLGRQLQRLDLGISAADMNTKGVSGPNYIGDPVSLNTSSTLGALVQIRYVRSPLVGFEFNYGYARLTENYNFATANTYGPPAGPFPVQTQMNEYTFGYLAHLRRFNYHGIQPFAGAGLGTTAFKPTTGGGEGLPEKARMTYYYTVGAEDMVSQHFGVRLQFRQLFYKDPDFGQNYLTIQQQTITTEPTFGFFLKY